MWHLMNPLYFYGRTFPSLTHYQSQRWYLPLPCCNIPMTTLVCALAVQKYFMDPNHSSHCQYIDNDTDCDLRLHNDHMTSTGSDWHWYHTGSQEEIDWATIWEPTFSYDVQSWLRVKQMTDTLQEISYLYIIWCGARRSKSLDPNLPVWREQELRRSQRVYSRHTCRVLVWQILLNITDVIPTAINLLLHQNDIWNHNGQKKRSPDCK